METLRLLLNGMGHEVTKGLLLAFVLSRFLDRFSQKAPNPPATIPSSSKRATLVKTVGFFLIFQAARVWLALLDKHVPEPYLVSARIAETGTIPAANSHSG